MSGTRSTQVDRVPSTRAARGAEAARIQDSRLTGLTAQPRTSRATRGGGFSNPYFNWAPSYYYPYSYFSPYWYGSFGWNRWGYGSSYYNPYLYDPFGYYSSYPYYWGHLSTRESWRDEDDDAREVMPMGSLRLRVSPREAEVYVDGALAGVVDEFDGFSDHLLLPAGKHQIEFRLTGYETLTLDVNVDNGKTRTERASLKRK